METITIEKLTPYLPYDLQVREYSSRIEKKELISSIMLSITKNPISFTIDTIFNGIMDTLDIEEFKPILCPLSYYGGSKTGGEVMQLLNCTLDQVYEIWNLDFEDITLDQVSYGTYKVMCKNKLDFNKLIPKGLAVNINTI